MYEYESAPKIYPKCAVRPSALAVIPTKGRVIDSSELQPKKANLAMLVTLSGIVISVSELHPWKAYPPMLVTPAEMVTDVSELHPWKA